MNKPLFIVLCIWVYKIVFAIIKLPFKFIKYFSLGLFFTLYFFINSLINCLFLVIKSFLRGFVFISFLFYKFIKYLSYGIIFPFVLVYDVFKSIFNKSKLKASSNARIRKQKIEEKKALKEQQRIEQQQKMEEKNALKEQQKAEKQQKIEEKNALKEQQRIEKQQQIEERKTLKEQQKAEQQQKIEEKNALKEQKRAEKLQKIEERKALKEQQRIEKQQKMEEKNALKEQQKAEQQQKNEDKHILEEKRKEEKLRIIEEKRKVKLERQKKREQDSIRKQEELAAKKKKMQEDVYINENVKFEKKNFASHINSFMSLIAKLPDKIKTVAKQKYENSTFVKNKKNRRDMDRQALLINFDDDDAKKSDVKIVYQYEAKTPEGKFVKDTFEAFSKVEVHSYLLSLGYEVYTIKTSKTIQMLHGQVGSAGKVKTKDLIFFLTQLSTYIKAGIPLVEALKILSRQNKKKSYQRMFRTIIYDLTMGDNFSTAIEKQGNAFPRLLINMLKASELTGELPEALDDMAEYYTQTEKTRKQMITAMTYPTIIFVMALAVMTFVMVYVVPNFVNIYANIDGASIPGITKTIMSISDFLKSNLVWILIGVIVALIVFLYLYKNVKVFKTLVQWFLMHLPVVGNVIIYNEVTMFTKTFASLLKHNVFITDSMEILNKITNNEIYKTLILDTIANLARGEKISTAFKDQWSFPLPAYEMIVTGEKTGQLAEMMQKVSDYYQELHANAVTRIKTFVEPILIIFLTGGVGVVVLSIVIPMFDIYNSVQISDNDSSSLLG